MSQEPFGDIPLFREIQKILASGQGPINFEIARQVAEALTAQHGADPSPEPEVFGWFTTAAHESEGLIAGYTRLPVGEPALARTITRNNWVQQTLEGWRWVLERFSERLSSEVTRMSPEAGPESNPMQAVMGQVAPLLLGIQTGTLLGHLSAESLGRFDPAIPRQDDGRLFFVAGNVAQVARDYSFDLETFCRWLALRDVARHLVLTSNPWIDHYFRSLLSELVDSIEIDAGDLERRLTELQSLGMEALQEGGGVGEVLPIVQTPRHQSALDRLRAFVVVFDGYAMHASDQVAEALTGPTPKIDEGMSRHQASPSEGKTMLNSLLGVSLDRSMHAAGVTFCAAVIQMHGIASLNEMWAAPDNLPTYEEVKDPFAWIERVLTN